MLRQWWYKSNIRSSTSSFWISSPSSRWPRTLSQHTWKVSSYNVIKAKFDSLLGSRIKLSYETQFPETILRTTDNQETAGKGGTTWAPRFATPALFDDQLRTGVHCSMLDGVEKAYEMIQKQVDAEFPIRHFSRTQADDRKIHTIISDHNRMGYRQTITFIKSLLPIYKTFLQGGLSTSDSWDRTRVYVVEFINSIQHTRGAVGSN